MHEHIFMIPSSITNSHSCNNLFVYDCQPFSAIISHVISIKLFVLYYKLEAMHFLTEKFLIKFESY